MYLRCAVQDSPQSWKSWLALAELWYNSSLHTALGCSPFKALYGYEPNLGAVSSIPWDTSPSVAEIIEQREQHLQSLKQNMARAQNRMKLLADQKHQDFTFSARDQALLKLQPYTQSTVASRPYPKLAFKYFWPYKVLERVGHLQLPEDYDSPHFPYLLVKTFLCRLYSSLWFPTSHYWFGSSWYCA